MIGGLRGDEILRDVWILDPETGRWRAGPAMPEPMELLGGRRRRRDPHGLGEHLPDL